MIEELSEELYNVLGELLNRKESSEIVNSLRGEYGVLRRLLNSETPASATELGQSLNVVPGRIADILSSLEKKGLIDRERDSEDKRVVRVSITEKGREAAEEKRMDIRREYKGLYELLGKDDTEELIRLLYIVLSYNHPKK